MIIAIVLFTAAFLAECGPAVDPKTTQAIIQVESGGDPLAIGDNNLRRSFAPKTAREAVSLAKQLMAQGHSLDLGLMQINNRHLASLHLTLDEIFDPCRNIRAGTGILADFYRQSPPGDPAQRLMNALSAYNTGQAWKGPGYVNRILAAAGVNYRVQFVPAPAAEAPGSPPPKKKRPKATARSAPLFFGNTTSALTSRKGIRAER